MLIEIAIGDAYGMGFEFEPIEKVKEKNNLTHYVKHSSHTIVPGSYTDDTQMTIAVMEEILHSGYQEDSKVVRWNYANRFLQCYKRDPRLGYSRYLSSLLDSIENTDEFLAQCKGNSNKSGGAMRACPSGIFPTIEQVMNHSKLQASITHNSVDGIGAAQAVALATHFGLYNIGSISDLPVFLKDITGNIKFLEPWEGPAGPNGMDIARAAITACSRNTRLSALLKNSVDFSGDTDTICAIAMGIGSSHKDYENDIPTHLIGALEKDKYGYSFLKELDNKFLSFKNTKI